MFRACDRNNVETVSLIQYVTESEQLRKWMVEFLSKFLGRGMPITLFIYCILGVQYIEARW